ncbi:HAMP domain-containing histidine kinase [Sulfurospirillum sp. T05]|uniref:histidine kinase n=1 Tax=Sulfurospirillum tamanense TaxID=2813362 RepID=A0ABS2WU83_9BACT|nr:HAMP domain-containing sensor histidine kinase [Sulfurospirillum tamanensis]MBN2965200.1 HAMP domain-containing histidine kinase [Sulfurospirillum tamanensis]
MDIGTVTDDALLGEIDRRFKEKQSSIEEMEFLTKKLLEMNEKSKKAQEVKSQFLSLVKNEFNNPVSSLLSVADMLQKVKDPSRAHAMGELLKRDLLKIDFSLKNIFAASEIEAGDVSNDYNRINIEELFEEIREYFALLIKDKSLHVILENHCDKEFISDSYKLYLILINLVSNACEFSYEGKEVTIQITCNDSGHVIKVKNFGEGISEDHTKEIYNRFVHFETGHTRATAGLGLGLSVARGMCEAMEGTIDNDHEGEATVFTVRIPYPDEQELSTSQAFGSNEFMFEENDGLMEF